MKLIADAGGTKADWRLLEGEKIEQFRTSGYNPHTHELNDFTKDVTATFGNISDLVTKVYYYGASIYPDNEDFKNALLSIFPNSKIELNNDLVGSCRSLSANEPGFVGILGTGSAGCFYDGEQVAIHVPSMGHALGDEGSGAKMGVRLLKMALRKRLEPETQRLFDETFQLSKDDVYARVYRGEHPNAYLASFAKFILENKDHTQLDQIIRSELLDFFEAYFMGMPDKNKHQVHCTGSVAYHFSDYIRAVGNEMGFSIGRIVQGPAAGLALYHKKYG